MQRASEFLAKCQVIEPYVEKGKLRGCVCPWEIGESADGGAFPILEDFHDTLEAIWVWSYDKKISGKQTFKPNIDWAWRYALTNWNRFIGGRQEIAPKSLYDCSHFLYSGTTYQEEFNEEVCVSKMIQAGDYLQKHLANLEETKDREYSDPFWMAHCLGLAARKLNQNNWLETVEEFLERTVVECADPFSDARREPRHIGPGGHDFFSKNANKALALSSCLVQRTQLDGILLGKFLPRVSEGFVPRHTDENAWNAHLATALGRSYVATGNLKFLRCYFAIMDELRTRDTHRLAALPRAPSFRRRESWVTFFFAQAYVSVL